MNPKVKRTPITVAVAALTIGAVLIAPTSGSARSPALPAPARAACPTVSLGIADYKPAKNLKKNRVPGVRSRINVSEPSLLEITPEFRFGGGLSVDFTELTLSDYGERNLRVPLPASVGNLTPGAKVNLILTLTATPFASTGCTDPPIQRLHLKTKVTFVRNPLVDPQNRLR